MNNAGRIGFLIKGNYDNTATYDFLDVVYFGNSSYVAKKLTTGNAPETNSEYWQILSTTPDNAVTGIKGAAETDFRSGNVILTPKNIGLCNVDNTSDSEKNVLSAKKLSVNANTGTATTPTYFKDGVPVPCSYSLEKSVPANAVFTDTVYSLPTAGTSTKGGIKTGYSTSGKNYKVQVDSSGNGYVNVPWTDTVSGYKKDLLFSGEALRQGTNERIDVTVTNNLTDYFAFEITNTDNKTYLVSESGGVLPNVTDGEILLRFNSGRVSISKTSKTFTFWIDSLTALSYSNAQEAVYLYIHNTEPVHCGITKIYGYKFT